MIRSPWNISTDIPEEEDHTNRHTLTVVPNPATSDLALHLNLFASGSTSIELVNVNGQEVQLLDIGVLPAGEHVIPFSATELHSWSAGGMLFVRVKINDEYLTETLLLST